MGFSRLSESESKDAVHVMGAMMVRRVCVCASCVCVCACSIVCCPSLVVRRVLRIMCVLCVLLCVRLV